ncbi:G-protein coupled receptor 4 [Liparis tanakae]|uniref:G-protein coupled receptor 4 n=1 Tax=Liparis tanakae TaxID=230148 RepID=A0A4Z2FY70_9TELE|nr:G-protein coupled receptor 4 [Liparis tanakae]
MTTNNTVASTTAAYNRTECVDIGASAISDLLMSIYILAFVFGLIFNMLTLGPIYQQVRRQNVLGIFLLNLLLSDTLFLLTMPLWINYYRRDHHWKLGVVSCSVAGFFYYSNMYISIYLLCCISVDRCLVVTYPLRSKTHRTGRYAWAQCAAVYAVVIAMHIMVLVNDNLFDAHDGANDRCYETYPMEKPVAGFNMARVGVGFLLPLLVLALSYWRVLATVGQSPGLSAAAKRKVRLLSFGVIGIFSICFAPYHVLLFTRSFVFFNSNNDVKQQGSYCQFEQKMHFWFSCTLALSSLNCVVDPVLYVLVSNGVQEEVKLFWRRQWRTKTADCASTKDGGAKSCFPSRQSSSLHLPLITSLVPHYLHLVLMPVSPVAHSLFYKQRSDARLTVGRLPGYRISLQADGDGAVGYADRQQRDHVGGYEREAGVEQPQVAPVRPELLAHDQVDAVGSKVQITRVKRLRCSQGQR